MKTLELKRMKGHGEEIIYATNEGVWGPYICSEGLWQVFDIPKKAKQIWVTTRTSERTGYYKVVIKNDYITSLGGDPIFSLLDVDLLLEFREQLIPVKSSGVAWVKVEYA